MAAPPQAIKKLIAARVLQGLGGAILTPQTLGTSWGLIWLGIYVLGPPRQRVSKAR
ncbi:MAG TPA: hypothetical protein VF990_17180 [Candidatus Dormibacteraeota bacterium]